MKCSGTNSKQHLTAERGGKCDHEFTEISTICKSFNNVRLLVPLIRTKHIYLGAGHTFAPAACPSLPRGRHDGQHSEGGREGKERDGGQGVRDKGRGGVL